MFGCKFSKEEANKKYFGLVIYLVIGEFFLIKYSYILF